MKYGTFLLAMLSAVPSATSTAADRQPSVDSSTNSAEYVSLGSSYAAGAGIGPIQAGSPKRCSRTVNNYASLLAERLNLTLNDQSCGGAKAEHILQPWEELPAQIDAVNVTTRLVTVTVGGNDLNFVRNLIMAGCDPLRGLEYNGQTMPCAPVRAPTEEQYAKVEARLTDIATQVRNRAPNAILVFVQYVSLLPEKPCPSVAITGFNATILREQARNLAQATARAAKKAKAMILPADRLSLNHTPCDPAPWANGSIDGPYDPTQPAPWHPNASGHAAIANALFKKLKVSLLP